MLYKIKKPYVGLPLGNAIAGPSGNVGGPLGDAIGGAGKGLGGPLGRAIGSGGSGFSLIGKRSDWGIVAITHRKQPKGALGGNSA